MIKTLDRYLLQYFIASLIIVGLAIGLLIVAINMVSELRSFIDHNIPISDILTYYVYFAGWVLRSFLPVFVLLASLTSIGILARRNEILAMKASGISLYRISAPILIFTFLLSIGHFYYSEFLFADANKERVEMEQFAIKGRSRRAFNTINNLQRQINQQSFYTITTYQIDKMLGEDIKIFKSKENKLAEMITAKSMEYGSSGWILYNGMQRIFTDSTDNYTTFDSMIATMIKDKPKDFEKPLNFTEEMGYNDLSHYIDVMKRTGGKFQKELVDLKMKVSYPLSSFIVILICIPIASNPKRGGIAVSFAVGFGIALLYFVCFKVIQSLARGGSLNPDFSAWIINAVFLLAGLIIMLKAKK
ncbi:MAG: LptF/LptG family permease [Candidatus Zixiibacteriota bacterium]